MVIQLQNWHTLFLGRHLFIIWIWMQKNLINVLTYLDQSGGRCLPQFCIPCSYDNSKVIRQNVVYPPLVNFSCKYIHAHTCKQSHRRENITSLVEKKRGINWPQQCRVMCHQHKVMCPSDVKTKKYLTLNWVLRHTTVQE